MAALDDDSTPDLTGLTSRGKPKIVKDGYAYVQDKRGKDGIVYWRCEKKMATQRKIRLLNVMARNGVPAKWHFG